jgi:hypothetical protein
MIALFNNNKNFIGFCDNFPDNEDENFLKLEVPKKYSDPSKYTWIGDYYNGGFVELNKIIQSEYNEDTVENFIKKYPIQIQIINIIKQLDVLSKKSNIYDLNFKEMSTEILKIWK